MCTGCLNVIGGCLITLQFVALEKYILNNDVHVNLCGKVENLVENGGRGEQGYLCLFLMNALFCNILV